MNERIRELAEQAKIEIECDDYGEIRLCEAHGGSLEKFAQLIVGECAGLAKIKSNFIGEQAMKFAEDADEETTAKATAWQFLVFEQEIKKHFGVE